MAVTGEFDMNKCGWCKPLLATRIVVVWLYVGLLEERCSKNKDHYFDDRGQV